MSAARRMFAASTDELSPATFADVNALCEAAFGESFASAWDSVGPGIHVIASVAGLIVSHAMVVDRRVYVGHEMGDALDAGYVEHVATLPAAQREGHASAVMQEIGRLIEDEYALGALSTGSGGFYARLGWERWLGPTWVRMPDGERIRTPDEDGGVMVLPTPRTPSGIDLRAPIAVDWRSGEVW